MTTYTFRLQMFESILLILLNIFSCPITYVYARKQQTFTNTHSERTLTTIGKQYKADQPKNRSEIRIFCDCRQLPFAEQSSQLHLKLCLLFYQSNSSLYFHRVDDRRPGNDTHGDCCAENPQRSRRFPHTVVYILPSDRIAHVQFVAFG